MLSSSHFTVGASQLVKMISKLGLGAPPPPALKSRSWKTFARTLQKREREREGEKRIKWKTEIIVFTYDLKMRCLWLELGNSKRGRSRKKEPSHHKGDQFLEGAEN